MKLCTLGLVVVIVVLCISGCGETHDRALNDGPTGSSSPTSIPTTAPDEFAAARANYARHCSECHGPEGKGGLVKVEDVKLKVPSLTEGHALNHTDGKLVRQITNGGEGMPRFEDKLSREEIFALVRFVRHEFQGKN
jgi:mono/diheme cytochrome c family protein